MILVRFCGCFTISAVKMWSGLITDSIVRIRHVDLLKDGVRDRSGCGCIVRCAVGLNHNLLRKIMHNIINTKQKT